MQITKRLEWDSGHRLLRHESKCAHVHGHRYAAELTLSAAELDSVGRVVDFSVIKELVGGWIDDQWDHAFLVNREDREVLAFLVRNNQRHFVFDCEPTAENIARKLMHKACELLSGHDGLYVLSVRVWETPTSSAIAVVGDAP